MVGLSDGGDGEATKAVVTTEPATPPDGKQNVFLWLPVIQR